MYWAAWAVMITGVTLNEPDFYDWAKNKYFSAMDQMESDGSLPLETARQGKAFNYHVFAAHPLIMMAETGERNGDKLYAYKEGALHKLVNLIVSELDNNQQILTKKTGKVQNLDGTITSSMLAWMVPYHTRFQTPALEKWIKKSTPMKQRRIGGNMSLLFSKETKAMP